MIKSLTSYFWMILTGLVCSVFMFRLNRTIIVGRRNLPDRRNLLIIANHLTMIDSWFVTAACVWPQAIRRFHLLPWHLPEVKNYFSNRFLAFMCSFWRCIPIERGSGDFFKKKLPIIVKRLKAGSLMVFPEGGRSREPKSGKIYRWRKGAALIATKAKPTVIPVAIRGVEDILPIGHYWPRIFRTVVIVIGPPLKLDDCYQEPDEKIAQQKISERMHRRLQSVLNKASALLEHYQQKT